MMEPDFDDIDDVEDETGDSLADAFPSASVRHGGRKAVSPLPPSDDKEFWGEDAEIVLAEKPRPKAPQGCQYVQHGPWEVCVSCPNQHTRVPQHISK